MAKLSQRGYRVLFVQPVDKKNLRAKSLTNVLPNVWALSVPGLPYERCSRLMNFINGKIAKSHILKAVDELKFDDYIVWFDRVHGTDFSFFLKNDYVVYDLIDEILAFGRVKNKSLLLSLEKKVVNRCDLLLSSSGILMERKIKQYGRNGRNHFLPNGVDCSRFDIESASKNSKPVIGFVGDLSDRRINYSLISQMAEIRPDWNFVFVGPGATVVGEKLHSANVIFKEAVSGDKIPDVISGFDVGIIPYNIGNTTMDYVFPRKACEYLAAGIPVVSTSLEEIKLLKPFVETAETADEMVLKIDNSLTSSVTSNERRQFALKFDWDNLLDELLELL